MPDIDRRVYKFASVSANWVVRPMAAWSGLNCGVGVHKAVTVDIRTLINCMLVPTGSSTSIARAISVRDNTWHRDPLQVTERVSFQLRLVAQWQPVLHVVLSAEVWEVTCSCSPPQAVSSFIHRGCGVVSTTYPYGRIPGFLDRICYYFFQVAPQLYSRGWVDPVPGLLLLTKSLNAGNRTLTSGSVGRDSDY
jgi:hypothetical protein